MEIGAKHTVRAVVTPEMTAQAVKSGDVPVLATPVMTALMEQAAMELAARFLAPEETTVGVSVAVEHLSATPVGMAVEAVATLTAAEGRMLHFSMEARDARGAIGTGAQKRAIVDRARFVQKAYAKLGASD